MGLIFTRGDLKEVSEEVAKYKVRLIDSIFCFRLVVVVCFFPTSVYHWFVKTESSINV